jgi:hypothetical protein
MKSIYSLYETLSFSKEIGKRKELWTLATNYGGDISHHLWFLYHSCLILRNQTKALLLSKVEVAEPDPTRETRLTRPDPNPIRFNFLRKSN